MQLASIASDLPAAPVRRSAPACRSRAAGRSARRRERRCTQCYASSGAMSSGLSRVSTWPHEFVMIEAYRRAESRLTEGGLSHENAAEATRGLGRAVGGTCPGADQRLSGERWDERNRRGPGKWVPHVLGFPWQ